MKIPRQCGILVGGLGTRLGPLTAQTQKPLLDCGGRPFLAWVLRELSRFGIDDVILFAGHFAQQVEAFVGDAGKWLPKPMRIRVSVEPAPAGTGGAIWNGRELLSDSFLIVNGDSWLDTNLADFLASAAADHDGLGWIMLREVADTARYGVVDHAANGRVTAFHARANVRMAGTVNGGIYVLRKEALEFFSSNCSLEHDVLPRLATLGLLRGHIANGYFIDIGIPGDYARAQTELPQRLHRPAVFFDRDGVLNRDRGWVGSVEHFDWIEGAKDAVRLANNAGMHAFVVTNQAGVARGLYSENDVEVLHRWMEESLRCAGGTLDDIRYCPHHPAGSVSAYRKACEDRKPGAGMLLDLARRWEINLTSSFLIGDKQTDLDAAESAGMQSFLFAEGSLAELVASKLNRLKMI